MLFTVWIQLKKCTTSTEQYLRVLLHFFRSVIKRLLPGNDASNNIPSNRWVIAYVFQICYALASYEKITEGLEPIRNGEIFSMSNKEICMTLLYFLVVFI